MDQIETAKIIKTLQIAFRYKRLNFFKRAFKERKDYGNNKFVVIKLKKYFQIETKYDGYPNLLELSKELAWKINEQTLALYLDLTFYIFCRIALYTLDREYKGKKIKRQNDLLKKIVNEKGTMHYMVTLKHLFVKLGRLSDHFYFGNQHCLWRLSNFIRLVEKNDESDYEELVTNDETED